MIRERFPYKIGYDCAGIITEIGDGVKRLKIGDEVYARLPEKSKGNWDGSRLLYKDSTKSI